MMYRKPIIQRENGFTLVELLITMAVFVLVMAAASQVFTGLLTQFKQQSRIAETNIEGIIGLEILRQDIMHAGYGLPWVLPVGVSYTEASDTPASNYNDIISGSHNPPRGILSGNDVNTVVPDNPTDYLVIKAVNIAGNEPCRKWTTLRSESPNIRTWDPDSENLEGDDNVMVLDLGTTDANARTLVTNALNNFNTDFAGVTSSPWTPLDATTTRVVYGINTSTDPTPVRPFNRADYFIQRPVSGMPSRCAPQIGILFKALMNHNGTGTFSMTPLLDCVADMQVIFAMDNDEDGEFNVGVGTPADGYDEDITALTSAQVRNRLKEVRVYILSHEGQKDPNYNYPYPTIQLGGDVGLGRTFDLTKIGDPEYKYYRWKIYTIVVKPFALTSN